MIGSPPVFVYAERIQAVIFLVISRVACGKHHLGRRHLARLESTPGRPGKMIRVYNSEQFVTQNTKHVVGAAAGWANTVSIRIFYHGRGCFSARHCLSGRLPQVTNLYRLHKYSMILFLLAWCKCIYLRTTAVAHGNVGGTERTMLARRHVVKTPSTMSRERGGNNIFA